MEKRTRSSTSSPVFHPTATFKGVPQKIDLKRLKSKLFYMANKIGLRKSFLYYLLVLTHAKSYWHCTKTPCSFTLWCTRGCVCNSLSPTCLPWELLILQALALQSTSHRQSYALPHLPGTCAKQTSNIALITLDFKSYSLILHHTVNNLNENLNSFPTPGSKIL